MGLTSRYALTDAGLGEALRCKLGSDVAEFLMEHGTHVYPKGHIRRLLENHATHPAFTRWESLFTYGWGWEDASMAPLDPIEQETAHLGSSYPWKRWRAADVLLVSTRCVATLANEPGVSVLPPDSASCRPEVAKAPSARATATLHNAAANARTTLGNRSDVFNLMAGWLVDTHRLEIYDAHLGRDLALAPDEMLPSTDDRNTWPVVPWLIAGVSRHAPARKHLKSGKQTGGIAVRLITDLPAEIPASELGTCVATVVEATVQRLLASERRKLLSVEVAVCPFKTADESVTCLTLYPRGGKNRPTLFVVDAGLRGMRTPDQREITLERHQNWTQGFRDWDARMRPALAQRGAPIVAWQAR